MPEAYETDIKQLFADAQLRVPIYQRAYAWSTKEVGDLLSDVDYVASRLESTDAEDVYHYFGTLVLDEQDGETAGPGWDSWTVYDIIDGQQRITTVSLVMGCMAGELERLAEAFEAADVDPEADSDVLPDGVVDGPAERAEALRRQYIKKGGGGTDSRRLCPNSLSEDAYQTLAVFDEAPASVLDGTDQLVPATKLAEAKTEITDEWLADKRPSAGLDGADPAALGEYYGRLSQLIHILEARFKLTVHEVPNAGEAGRLFEAVNDRGRAITLADKVRSYLIYVAGELDDALDTEEVARKFNDAVQMIAHHGDDEDDVDQFIRYHWELFTGEYKKIRKNRTPTAIHRRMKHSERHAALDPASDDADVVEWVEAYTDSLKPTANAFVEATNLDVFEDRYGEVDGAVVDRLHSLQNYGYNNVIPLVMAALRRFNPTDDAFVAVIDAAETYSFRVYQVMKRSSRTGRREIRREAHRLYVAGEDGDYHGRLFGGEPPYELYDGDPATAATKVAQALDSYTGQHCPESDFRAHLTKDDVISGSNTRGWPGFCNKGAIRYLLYEYEKALRAEGGDTGSQQLPAVDQLDEFEIEHIAPRSPATEAAALADHEDNVDRLANLALLGPTDNKSADNREYAAKYTDVYEDAMMRMLRADLPDPSSGWDLDAVDDREADLVAFCLERWGGRTTGVVHVRTDGDADGTVLTEDRRERLRSAVETAHEGATDHELPRVRVTRAGRRESTGDADADGFSACDCGATEVQIDDEGDLECVCGRSLDRPSYVVYRDEAVGPA